MLRCDTKSQKADGKPDAVEHQDFWQSLRDRLYRVWLDHGHALRELPTAEEVAPPALQAREREVWLPLFQMAKILERLGVGGRLLQSLQQYACDPNRVSDEATAEGLEEYEYQILKAFAELHPGGSHLEAFPTPDDVLTRTQENNPGQYGILKVRTVGHTLSRYHIKTHRTSEKRHRHCSIEHLQGLERRYAVKLPRRTPEKNDKNVIAVTEPKENGVSHGINIQKEDDVLSGDNKTGNVTSDDGQKWRDVPSDEPQQTLSSPKPQENKGETPTHDGLGVHDVLSNGSPTSLSPEERRAALLEKEVRLHG